MSKKKNTLKDLDEFLKQQAASLVSPEKLSEKIEQSAPVRKPVAEQQAQVVATPEPVAPVVPVTHVAPVVTEVTAQTITNDLKTLAGKEGYAFRGKLYDIIINSLDSAKSQSPEDMMLINTALYLKSGDNWKEAIQEYWRNK